MAIAIAALLITWVRGSNAETAWITLVYGSALVVLFEVLQLINPARNFELEDIQFGLAGIAAGAILAYCLVRLLGRTAFAFMAIVSTLIVGVPLGVIVAQGSSVESLSCGIQTTASSDWESMLITDFSHNAGAATGNKIGFCVAEDDLVAGNNISYSAELRLSLEGLAEAVRQQGTFVMGIQFTTGQTRAFSEIVSLTWQGTATSYFARLFRRGMHLMAILQFNGGEQTSTAMANRAEPDKLQELVMLYDGNLQTTFLNGEVVGTELNVLNPPKNDGAELVLNIGQTADRKWWVPFEGEIQGIYLGTRIMAPEQVPLIFSSH